ncbi:MAG: hypothetical protein V4530_15040 [Pseudomonadota bacterium]
MKRSVAVCVALLLSTPAYSEPAPVQPKILTTAKSVRVVPAQIELPQQAGLMTLESSKEYGSDGFDNVIQYASPDKQISGTAFVYFPSLPDTGLTFLATDAIIRKRFGEGTRVASDQLVAVGGVANAGRKVVYGGASNGTRSTAAMFVRAGGWIIVLRMSGPASRASEIEMQIDAVAAKLSFAKDSKPYPATLVTTSGCKATQQVDADVVRPSQAAVLERTLIPVSNNMEIAKKKLWDPPVPAALCLSGSSDIKDVITQDFQLPATPKKASAARKFRLVGDAGYVLEVTGSKVEPGVYLVIRYGIGSFDVLGAFRGIPSDAQLDRITAQDGSIPVLARVEMSAGGNSNITLNCDDTKEGCAAKNAK